MKKGDVVRFKFGLEQGVKYKVVKMNKYMYQFYRENLGNSLIVDKVSYSGKTVWVEGTDYPWSIDMLEGE